MISYNATINRIQSPIPWNCSTPIGASFLCAPWEIRCMAASKAPWSMGLDTLRQPFKLDHFIGNTWLVQAPMLSGIYASWTIMNSCCDEKTWKYGVLLGFESYMNIVELDARCNATYSYSIIFIHVWHVLTACSTCHVLFFGHHFLVPSGLWEMPPRHHQKCESLSETCCTRTCNECIYIYIVYSSFEAAALGIWPLASQTNTPWPKIGMIVLSLMETSDGSIADNDGWCCLSAISGK